MVNDMQNLPEAQRLDYAPPPARKRFPWLLLFSSPFLAIGAGCLVGGLLSRAHDDMAIFCATGIGFLVFGSMLVLIHLRWK